MVFNLLQKKKVSTYTVYCITNSHYFVFKKSGGGGGWLWVYDITIDFF